MHKFPLGAALNWAAHLGGTPCMSMYLPTLSPLLDPPFLHPPTCLCPLLLFSPPPLPPSLLCFSPSVFLSAFAALLRSPPLFSSLFISILLASFPLLLSSTPPLPLFSTSSSSHSSPPPPPTPPPPPPPPPTSPVPLISSPLLAVSTPLVLSSYALFLFPSLTLGSCAPPPHPLLLSGFSLVSLSRPSSTPPRVLTPFPLFLHLLSSSLVSLSCSPLCETVRCLIALISAWWKATWVRLNHRPGGLDQWANLHAHVYTTWSKLFYSKTISTIFRRPAPTAGCSFDHCKSEPNNSGKTIRSTQNVCFSTVQIIGDRSFVNLGFDVRRKRGAWRS